MIKKSLHAKKTFLVGILFLAFFLLLRLPGISLPFHQDEMKTALGARAGGEALGSFFHPPLTQLLYRTEAILFGADSFRLFILIFSLLGGVLATFIVKRRLGLHTTLFFLLFLATGAYSVHASLMLDTDGAILPLFFLASIYFYDRIYETEGNKRRLFFGLMFLSLILGFLVKLSFILVVGAIMLDFLYRERKRLTKKMIIISVLSLIGFFLCFLLAIFAIKFFNPFFSIEGMVSHLRSFINFKQRGWMQILIQALKAIFYLSPVLIVPLLFITKEIFEKTRIFFIYLGSGFIFYFIIFDFSQGALDKYLMFSIIPLSVISAAIITPVIEENKEKKKIGGIVVGILGAITIILLALLPHTLFPLYPKTLWLSNIVHFNWNILFPLTGGSGPLGFYMSFLVIAFSFIFSFILGLIALFKRNFRYSIFIAILIIGLTHNVIFTQEFLYGGLYGSAPKVLKESLEFIENSPNIKEVITYNDSGGYELHKMEKYAGRFYAVPGYEEGHKKKFAEFKGHYLVVDMPKISKDSFYGQFFAKCTSLFKAKSRAIESNVYECSTSKK